MSDKKNPLSPRENQMGEKSSHRSTILLKLLALLCLNMFFLPFAGILQNAQGDSPNLSVFLAFYGALAAASFLGFFLSQIWEIAAARFIEKSLWAGAGRLALKALSVGSGALFLWAAMRAGHFNLLVAGVGGTVSFLLGHLMLYRGGDGLFSMRAILAGVLCFLLMPVTDLLLGSSKFSTGMTNLVPFLLFFAAGGLVLLNQDNMAEILSRRKDHSSTMPTKMRRYNLYLTLIAIGLLLVLYLFHGAIASLIMQLAKGLVVVLISLIGGFFKLMGMLLAKGSGEGSDSGGDSYDMWDTVSQSGNNPWDAATVVLILVVVVLAFFLLKKLIPTFSAWLSYLKGRALALLSRLLSPGEKDGLSHSEEFVDHAVMLEVSRQQRETRKSGRQAVKKQVRAFEREKDGVRKVRMGYRLAEEALMPAVSIQNSDTARQILHKAQDSPAYSSLDGLTVLYEQVRYGDHSPTPEECLTTEKEVKALLIQKPAKQ